MRGKKGGGGIGTFCFADWEIEHWGFKNDWCTARTAHAINDGSCLLEEAGGDGTLLNRLGDSTTAYQWTFRTFHPPVKFRRRKARRKRFAQLALNASIGGDAILGKGQPAYYTPLPEDREQKGWVASGQVMLNLNFG